MTEGPTEIPVSVAARIAGCSRDTIVRLIKEGAFVARQRSPHAWWKVDRQSLLSYLERMKNQ